MKTRIHLVIHGDVIGGTEKRLTAFWLHIQKAEDIELWLCLSQKLFDVLSKVPSLSGIHEYMSRVIIFPGMAGRIQQIQRYSRHVAANKGVKFHFAMWYPLATLSRPGILYSYPANSIYQLGFVDKMVLYYIICHAKFTDILDPLVYKQLVKKLPWRRKALRLCPSSFVDMDALPEVMEKKNWLVFLGRYIQEKQVIEFVRAVPLIHKRLKEAGINDAEFFVLGHGILKEQIEALAAGFDRSIPIHIRFVNDPVGILRQSKIFYSLQVSNNYPSNSLMEAIAMENMIVVTDSGTTRMLAREEFSSYVPVKFSAEDLAEATVQLMTLPAGEQKERTEKGKEFIRQEFSLEKMASYYLDIYREL